MSVTRHREMVPTKTTPKAIKPTLKNIEPLTPIQTHEPSALQLLPSIMPNPSPSSSDTPKPHPNSGFRSVTVPVLGTVRRRSLRLASKLDFTKCSINDSATDRCRKSKVDSDVNGTGVSAEGEIAVQVDGAPSVGDLENEESGLDSSGSGIRVLEVEDKIERAKMGGPNTELGRDGSGSGRDGSSSDPNSDRSEPIKTKTRKRALIINVDLNGSECKGEEGSKGFLKLRSGKRVLKRGMDLVNSDYTSVETSECRGQNDEVLGNGLSMDENGNAKRSRKMRKEGKETQELEKDNSQSISADAVKLGVEFETQNLTDPAVHIDGSTRQPEEGERRGKRKLDGGSEISVVAGEFDEGTSRDDNSSVGRRRVSREDKGKGALTDGDLLPNIFYEAEVELESKMKNSGDNRNSDVNHLADNVNLQEQEQLRSIDTRDHDSRRNEYMERFREIARLNASRFAHFTSDEEDHGSVPEVEGEHEIEDWPGPFSTALKIVKDREMKSVRTGCVYSERSLPEFIKWVPKRNQGQIGARFSVPSLQELCLNILAKNADAIVSLDSVPDALRHKLSQLLCDSRKMNNHIFELLASGSPTEIRLRDCSWLTEEQFTKSFQMCNTENLVVLQLDQSGRCMPDYVILATLAQSPKQLPRLTSLSLSGACRLSDGGLRALVSSCPALRSINLSQCSLLTSACLYILADSLGSLLKELYLDDCQGIDATLVVPALYKLEHLEVLSVAGIQTVCDEFIMNYIIPCGHNMKELVLKDCVNLTDSSMKVIAEHCPGLHALDVMNLCKLTDSSIGYLTNGCQALHTLKLCRNQFSDEAIAAFMETVGESLKELSLNNVKKVGHHTALSLASHGKNLHTLDLSWCRNLTDNAVGLIVDSCLSLRLLKLFGCTQITGFFLNGHSNPQVQIIGLKMSPVLQHVKVLNPQQGALHYSSVSS